MQRIPTKVTDHLSNKQTSVLAAMSMGLLLGGCGGVQSALAPHGPQAQAIAKISWVMFGGAAVILLLVMALSLYAIYRSPEKRWKANATVMVLCGGVALPGITLSALLVYGVHEMGSLRAAPSAPAAEIEVIGNQWWWDVHYRGPDGRVIKTANELRIPAGQPVMVRLRSNDVIHSFWVPNLAGKIDLVPGRINHIVLQADQTGLFRGQCAEFCGAQHARMAFHVIAEMPDAYAAWLAGQGEPARTPDDAVALRGRDVFLAHCVSCHTVSGVGVARGRGPDLSHVASRKFIAAGMVENNRENMVAFIARSQEIKPGSLMPSHAHLGEEAIDAIAQYLGTLK
jgi:cytochrome c oxidase subunit 2